MLKDMTDLCSFSTMPLRSSKLLCSKVTIVVVLTSQSILRAGIYTKNVLNGLPVDAVERTKFNFIYYFMKFLTDWDRADKAVEISRFMKLSGKIKPDGVLLGFRIN